MLTIITKATGNKVVATTTFDGKRKQRTLAVERTVTGGDHGKVAGTLAHSIIPQSQQTHDLRQRTTHKRNPDGSHTFTVG